MYKQMQMFSRV